MSDYRFLLKLYGVRGSYPNPSEKNTKYGGNTTCIMARTKSHIVFFDAGSGLIQAGKDLVPEIIEHKKSSNDPFHITIMFTHTHIDHLMGLNFFVPLYMQGVHINFIGPAILGVDLEDILSNLCEPQYHPVSMQEFRSTKHFENIHENMIIYFVKDDPYYHIETNGESLPKDAELVIKNMKYYFHPKDGSYNYRIEHDDKVVIFATDIEQYQETDQRLVNFSKNADILIHDAQYNLDQYKMFQGYGHSNYKMACDAANKANVDKLLLFHHDPGNDDAALEKIERKSKKIFSNSQLACEGWEWTI